MNTQYSTYSISFRGLRYRLQVDSSFTKQADVRQKVVEIVRAFQDFTSARNALGLTTAGARLEDLKLRYGVISVEKK